MDGSLSDPRSLARAASALRCLPLRRAFYERVAVEAISSGGLCDHPERSRYWFRPLTPQRAEDHLIWLIRLGVLRREVDGQGLTERVRLTPMGRQLLGHWPGELPRAGLGERVLHGLRRRRPRL